MNAKTRSILNAVATAPSLVECQIRAAEALKPHDALKVDGATCDYDTMTTAIASLEWAASIQVSDEGRAIAEAKIAELRIHDRARFTRRIG